MPERNVDQAGSVVEDGSLLSAMRRRGEHVLAALSQLHKAGSPCAAAMRTSLEDFLASERNITTGSACTLLVQHENNAFQLASTENDNLVLNFETERQLIEAHHFREMEEVQRLRAAGELQCAMFGNMIEEATQNARVLAQRATDERVSQELQLKRDHFQKLLATHDEHAESELAARKISHQRCERDVENVLKLKALSQSTDERAKAIRRDAENKRRRRSMYELDIDQLREVKTLRRRFACALFDDESAFDITLRNMGIEVREKQAKLSVSVADYERRHGKLASKARHLALQLCWAERFEHLAWSENVRRIRQQRQQQQQQRLRGCSATPTAGILPDVRKLMKKSRRKFDRTHGASAAVQKLPAPVLQRGDACTGEAEDIANAVTTSVNPRASMSIDEIRKNLVILSLQQRREERAMTAEFETVVERYAALEREHERSKRIAYRRFAKRRRAMCADFDREMAALHEEHATERAMQVRTLKRERDVDASIDSNHRSLKDKSEEMSAMFTAMMEPLIVFTSTYCVKSMNAAAARLFGYGASGDAFGTHIDVLVQGGGAILTALTRKQEILDHGTVPNGPLPVASVSVMATALTRTQEHISVLASCGASVVHDDRVFIVCLHDQRSIVAREEELTQATNRAIAADEAKSMFLASMSHEIRTPLSGVLSASALLADTELSTEQRLYCNIVSKSASALLVVINDVLDLSKLRAHKMEVEKIPFTLQDTMQHCLSMMAPSAQRKNLQLLLEYDHSLPAWIVGDPNRLGQVLRNLLTNAEKFTTEGSLVLQVRRATVETLPADLHISHPEADTAADTRIVLVFSVTDTGVGIDPAKISLLFTPFTQVDNTTSRVFGGTGLGLTICKELVELMHGSIVVRSRGAGRGCTLEFCILASLLRDPATLPSAAETHIFERAQKLLTQPDAAAVTAVHLLEAECGPIVKPGSEPPRILLIDDSVRFASVMIEMIACFGVTVTHIASSDDAVYWLGEQWSKAATPADAAAACSLVFVSQSLIAGTPCAEAFIERLHAAAVNGGVKAPRVVITMTMHARSLPESHELLARLGGGANNDKDRGSASDAAPPPVVLLKPPVMKAVYILIQEVGGGEACASAPGPVGKSFANQPIGECPSMHVLVVDDVKTNRLIAKRILEKMGHRVATASGGGEAIEMFKRSRAHLVPAEEGRVDENGSGGRGTATGDGDLFDLIFMDVHMPDMDGCATTEKLRGIERSQERHIREAVPPTPICALTADIYEASRLRCEQAGMNAVTLKPFSATELQAILGRAAAGGVSQLSCRRPLHM